MRMEFGKPINVGEFIAQNDQLTPQEQMNGMKDLLTERLHATIFHIANNEDYDATFEICNAVEPFEIAELRKDKANKNLHCLEAQFQANNQTLKRIKDLKECDPEKAEKLLELGKEAYKIRKKKGIDVESASVKKPLMTRAVRILCTLVTLPYTLPVSVLASPVVGICQFLFTKLKDPAFRNSVRFVMNLLIWPLLVVIYAIIACCLLPWQWALATIVLIMPAPIVAHEVWKTFRLTISDIKLLKEKKLKKIYSQIRDIILK